MICDLCDRGRHYRCGGQCDCAICPIVLRGNSTGNVVTIPRPSRPRYVPTGNSRGRPKGSTLPTNVQSQIIDGLRNGESMSSLARHFDTSRDRIRTLKLRALAPDPPVGK